jgi:serine protease
MSHALIFSARSIRIAFSLLILLTALASTVRADPPFRSGEIVVAGAPEEFSGTGQVVKYLPNANLTVLKVEHGREFAEAMRWMQQGRRAGVNYLATASFSIDDQYFTPYQWNFKAVQAEQAWDISTGSGVIVAVLDTGLSAGGQDGINCVVSPYNAISGDFNPDDGDGHGTHVSGTISQATNNGIGVAGLAFEACIMPVKVLGDNGSGTFADIAEGIYYAVDNGAQVINMSLGVSARYNIRSDALMDPALEYAFANGTTVVCASGNDGARRNVSYPAIYSTTIAVGATDFSDNVTRYSNKGDGLDLVAPGGDMLRDDNGDNYGDGILQETYIGGWNYYFFEGTSMASPHVAAAAALLLAKEPALTPADVYDRLTSTALDLNESGYDSTSGHGLLQAFAALTGPGPVEEPPSLPGGTDVDADGWTIELGDCDDGNPDVYPGHQDTKGKWGRDNVDNDCNGVIDG